MSMNATVNITGNASQLTGAMQQAAAALQRAQAALAQAAGQLQRFGAGANTAAQGAQRIGQAGQQAAQGMQQVNNAAQQGSTSAQRFGSAIKEAGAFIAATAGGVVALAADFFNLERAQFQVTRATDMYNRTATSMQAAQNNVNKLIAQGKTDTPAYALAVQRLSDATERHRTAGERLELVQQQLNERMAEFAANIVPAIIQTVTGAIAAYSKFKESITASHAAEEEAIAATGAGTAAEEAHAAATATNTATVTALTEAESVNAASSTEAAASITEFGGAETAAATEAAALTEGLSLQDAAYQAAIEGASTYAETQAVISATGAEATAAITAETAALTAETAAYEAAIEGASLLAEAQAVAGAAGAEAAAGFSIEAAAGTEAAAAMEAIGPAGAAAAAGEEAASVGARGLMASLGPIGLILIAISTALIAFSQNLFGMRDGINAVGTALGNAVPELKGFLTMLGQAGDFIAKTFGGKVVDATKKAGEGVKQMATMTQDEIDKANTAIQLFGDDTLKAAAAAGKGFDKFTEEEKAALGEATKALDDFNKQMDEVGKSVADKLSKGLEEGPKAFKKAVKDIQKEIGFDLPKGIVLPLTVGVDQTTIKSQAEAALGVLKNVLSGSASLSELEANAQQFGQKWIDSIMAGIDQQTPAMQAQLRQIVADIQAVMAAPTSPNLQKLATDISTLGSAAKTLDPLLAEEAKKQDELAKSAKDAQGPINNLGEAIQGVGPTTGTIAGFIPLRSEMDATAESAKGLSKPIAKGGPVQKDYDNLPTFLGNKLAQAKDGLVGGINAIWQGMQPGLNLIKSGLFDIFNRIINFQPEKAAAQVQQWITDNIVNPIKNLPKTLPAVGGQIWQKIQEGWNSTAGVLKQLIIDPILNLPNQVVGIGKKIWEEITKGIGNIGSLFTGGVKGATGIDLSKIDFTKFIPKFTWQIPTAQQILALFGKIPALIWSNPTVQQILGLFGKIPAFVWSNPTVQQILGLFGKIPSFVWSIPGVQEILGLFGKPPTFTWPSVDTNSILGLFGKLPSFAWPPVDKNSILALFGKIPVFVWKIPAVQDIVNLFTKPPAFTWPTAQQIIDKIMGLFPKIPAFEWPKPPDILGGLKSLFGVQEAKGAPNNKGLVAPGGGGGGQFGGLNPGDAQALNSALAQLNATINGLNTTISSFNGQLNLLSANFVNLRTSANTNFAAIQGNITGYLTTALTSLSTFIGNLQGLVNAFNTVRSGSNAAFAGIAGNIAGYLNTATSRLTTFGQAVAKLSGEFATARSQSNSAFSAIAGNIAGYLSSAAGKVNSFQSAVHSAFAKVKSDAASAAGGVNQLKSAIDSLKSKSITITTTFLEVHKTVFAAKGFHGVVSQPTNFTVGEGGRPEMVSVTPLGGGTKNASVTNQFISGDNKRRGKGGESGEPLKVQATVENSQPIIVVLDGKPIMKMVQKQTLRASEAIA